MAVAGAEELGEEPPEKRATRKPKPVEALPTKDKGKTVAATSLTKETVVKQVYGLHQIAALMLTPEAAISEADAELLGSAVYDVIKDSNLEWLSKYEKYINLAVAAVIVEVPTAMRVSEALKKKAKPATVAENEQPEKKQEGKIRTINGIAEGEPIK